MKLKADFHIHTYYSFDSSLPPKEIVKISREIGLDVIGVVDHGTCKGAIDTKNISKGNPFVLIGQETKTKDGEIIVFGLEDDMKQGLSLVETCKKAKKMGGFIVVPHPFDRFRWGVGKHIDDVIEYIDAVEAFNSMCVFDSFNKKAREFAEKNSIPMVAGSDAHFRNELGRGITIVECENKESILDAVKRGKTTIIGNKTGAVKRIKSRLEKKLKKK